MRELSIPRQTNWAAVAAVGIGVFMVAIDLTIVATGLPVLGDAFGVDPTRTQWFVLAYSLPLIALMIPAGRWVDDADPRRAFALGTLGFAAASALVGLAPTFEVALGARALQGVFGALLSVLLFAMVAAIVAPHERGRAFGLIGTLGPLGSVTGPGLGGLLIASSGWPAIFIVNVPVCALALLVGWRAIPSTGRLPGIPRSLLADAALAGIAVVGALTIVTGARFDSTDPTVEVSALAVVVAAAAWARRPSSAPIVTALRSRALSGQLAAMLFGATAIGATYFLIPFLLQRVLNESPVQSGLVLLALPAALALAAQLGGRASDRWGPRPVAVVANLLIIAGALTLQQVQPTWTGPDVAWRLALMGVGAGLFVAPNQAAIMSAMPRGLMGTAGALAGVARSLGFALGPAIAVALWSERAFSVDAVRVPLLLTAVAPTLALAAVVAARSPRPSDAPAPSKVQAA